MLFSYVLVGGAIAPPLLGSSNLMHQSIKGASETRTA